MIDLSLETFSPLHCLTHLTRVYLRCDFRFQSLDFKCVLYFWSNISFVLFRPGLRICMHCLYNWTHKMQGNTDTAIGSYFALMQHIICVPYGPERLKLNLRPMRSK